MDDTTFSFLEAVPEELQHHHYCQTCHAQTVEPELEKYQAMLALAREVFFFFSTRKKTFLIDKKAREEIFVKDCVDRNETILRLGFKAAQLGFNAVVDAEVEWDKVRDHAFQKTLWKGRGTPAQVDAEKLHSQYND